MVEIDRLKGRDVDRQRLVLQIAEHPAHPIKIDAQLRDTFGQRHIQHRQRAAADRTIDLKALTALKAAHRQRQWLVVERRVGRGDGRYEFTARCQACAHLGHARIAHAGFQRWATRHAWPEFAMFLPRAIFTQRFDQRAIVVVARTQGGETLSKLVAGDRFAQPHRRVGRAEAARKIPIGIERLRIALAKAQRESETCQRFGREYFAHRARQGVESGESLGEKIMGVEPVAEALGDRTTQDLELPGVPAWCAVRRGVEFALEGRRPDGLAGNLHLRCVTCQQARDVMCGVARARQ